MHAGGMPGYQSLFAYNPCTGVIIALAYNKQPKEDYVFMSILNDINNSLRQEILKHKNYVGNSSRPYPSLCEVLEAPNVAKSTV